MISEQDQGCETSRLMKKMNGRRTYIELIGSSGIGKTTLLRQFRKASDGEWLGVGDLDTMALLKHDEIHSDVHGKLLFSMSRLLEREELSSYQKAMAMSYLATVIVRDIKVIYNNSETDVFLDEGLCHNFVEQLVELGGTEFESVMKGRSIILVFSRGGDLIVERIRKREREKGKMVTHHHGKTDVELKAGVERESRLWSQLAERAEACGCRVMRLSAEDGNDYNVKLIGEFVQRCRGS